MASEGGKQMGITNSNKIIDVDSIACDGSVKVTLALTAAPDIVSNPTDIALVLDCSGSMRGVPLASMKAGAKTFIDIIFATCRDVLVKCIKFVVPEDLDVSGGSARRLCNPRNFKARFIAHNIDTDFRCCEAVVTM